MLTTVENHTLVFMGVLAVLAAVLWSLLIERWCFFRWVARAALVSFSVDPDHALRSYSALSDKDRLMVIADTMRFGRILPVLIHMAPVIGILGSITAMKAIFHALGSEKLSVFSLLPALAEAGLTTVMGIFIAVPAWLAFILVTRERRRLYRDMTPEGCARDA